MSADKQSSHRKRVTIVWVPWIVYLIALFVSIILVQMIGLPWLLYPGLYPSSIFRILELLFGVVLLLLGMGLITSGVVTLSYKRAMGHDIEQSVGTSLVSTGMYSYCRHPMTLGIVLATPGLGFIFDFVPMILNTLIASPLLVALLFYEELELMQRFEFTYTKYREKIPFLIPRRTVKPKKDKPSKTSAKKDKIPKPDAEEKK
jgi:protein-S-isoprenylcysteine O-methyltransferase Ste14